MSCELREFSEKIVPIPMQAPRRLYVAVGPNLKCTARRLDDFREIFFDHIVKQVERLAFVKPVFQRSSRKISK